MLISRRHHATTEKKLVLLMSAVQFMNVLDFVMIMPLGPDLGRAFMIPSSQLGIIGGSYTFAACISGVLCAGFLDRFDRRKALLISILGLAVATLLGALATGPAFLLFSRILAGAFGGPATSLSFSIVGDAVPEQRRGRAISVVMSAFSLASIFGVPFSLEASRLYSWRAPFFITTCGLILIGFFSYLYLPNMTQHRGLGALEVQSPFTFRGFFQSIRALFRQRKMQYAFVIVILLMSSQFLLIPNFSAYLQFNLGYPRKSLGMLYLVGGIISFIAVTMGGRLTDRWSPFVVSLIGSALLWLVLSLSFFFNQPLVPAVVMFGGFMSCVSLRNVAFASLSSLVPQNRERAQFLSLQSGIQNLASATGASMGTMILRNRADQSLEQMTALVALSVLLSLPIPFLIGRLHRLVLTKRSS